MISTLGFQRLEREKTSGEIETYTPQSGSPGKPGFGLLGWNPVTRGLVVTPEDWRWSSYRFFSLGEAGAVRVNEGWGEDFVPGSGGVASPVRAVVEPTLRKVREEWGTPRVGGRDQIQEPGHPPTGDEKDDKESSAECVEFYCCE